ncbi:hypothetical protein OXB_3572 [Bacillus sp. OxB-1]|uniref:hypothetical protein n=1 Tax=Bacillus sp. (strain OxB-1) TaxID=98228 RepID=UPI000581C7C9|nr:hypothetical protein [Bacillus sp. OxB-1]BAQ12041.1 hypothetical protein OXB_3572 [Bacillus sp. OxB-1]
MEVIPTPSKLIEKAKHLEKVVSLPQAAIMNIQLKAGEEVAEHHSERDVIIVVRKGIVRFEVEGNEVFVSPENLLHMAPFEKHSLRAIEDADILVFQVES